MSFKANKNASQPHIYQMAGLVQNETLGIKESQVVKRNIGFQKPPFYK
jgi:hypothetical protein